MTWCLENGLPSRPITCNYHLCGDDQASWRACFERGDSRHLRNIERGGLERRISNSRTGVVKVETVKLVTQHRNMRVSKIDVLDFWKQSRLTALQVLQQCATRLLSRMPHAWNKAMQSSLHKGGIQQITQWPFHLLVVETCSITLQTADMPDPIQHISMQEHIAADAPERSSHAAAASSEASRLPS